MDEETTRETVERVVNEAFAMREENKLFYEELDAESDRGAAILATEYFDGRLRRAIEEKFGTLDEGIRTRLKDESMDFQRRFLGSNFSTRINIAYVLGLYDQETRDRLNEIRKIRNRFAHPTISKPLNFDAQCIAKQCATLPLPFVPEPDSSRNRYISYLVDVGDRVWSALAELQQRTE